MHESYQSSLSEQRRSELRAQRTARRKAKFRAQRRKRMLQAIPIFVLLVALGTLFFVRARQQRFQEDNSDPEVSAFVPKPQATVTNNPVPYHADCTADTIALSEEIDSLYAILIDLQNNTVLAEKSSDHPISPASMTKILTLLVAVEHMSNPNDTVTITREITDYCFTHDCSVVGYMVDDQPTVTELLYGTILPSGADAALALANYVAGSQEAFVDLMNKKLSELGISETAHFTNCVGLYDEKHICTVYDMAMILKAAMENDLCRKVLSTHSYPLTTTESRPESQTMSNLFLRRIEDHDQDLTVRTVGAKTGYVMQAGSCAASWGEDIQGNRYICVTGNAASSWRVIYDHVALYALCGS